MNGQKFSRISHDDATLILKSSLLAYQGSRLPIKITVRYLGKLPVLATTASHLDTNIVLDSHLATPKGTHHLDQDDSIKSIFKSTKDFALFKHYVAEYLHSHIDVQYLLYLILNRIKLDKKVSAKNCWI